MNIFVTGTDTDVGKTVVSSWICKNTYAKYWKPIQTGDDSDKDFVKKYSPKTNLIDEIYKLKAPLSPYDSAKLESVSIDKNKLLKNIPDKTVIEGAGGLLVPICENFYMADIIKNTNSKTLIVAKSKLGFLNHIFLTVEYLKSHNIDILGIIINGETNLVETIEYFSKIKVLQILPFKDNVSMSIDSVSLPKEISEVLT